MWRKDLDESISIATRSLLFDGCMPCRLLVLQCESIVNPRESKFHEDGDYVN